MNAGQPAYASVLYTG